MPFFIGIDETFSAVRGQAERVPRLTSDPLALDERSYRDGDISHHEPRFGLQLIGPSGECRTTPVMVSKSAWTFMGLSFEALLAI